MLSICLCLCAGLFPIVAATTPEQSSDVSTQADASIIMGSDTRTVLYGRNMDQPYYPVSITKILTALIVLEQCDLNEMVIFSHDDVRNVEAGSNSAGIDEGDILIARNCLYALILASTNGSANVLACYISGSREAFAQPMNGKARSLSRTEGHFNNPNGLNDENHYTTAHDMALIARATIQNLEFPTINGTRSYQLAPTKRIPKGGHVANHHKMLNRNGVAYCPDAFAGKTGYISLAGNTLVTCARRNDTTLITVVLNGHQSHYSDTKALFDLGFRGFQSLWTVDCEIRYESLKNNMTITGMTSGNSISLELDRSGHMVVPRGVGFVDIQSALTYDLDGNHPQAAIACISYTYNDRPVGSVYLCFPDLKGSAALLVSQDTSGASAVSIGQDREADNPAPSDPSSRPDAPGLQDTPEAPFNVGTPHGQTPAPTPVSRQDTTSKEGIATNIRIPVSTLAILGIALSLAVIIAIVTVVKIHVRRREEEDLYPRRQ